MNEEPRIGIPADELLTLLRERAELRAKVTELQARGTELHNRYVDAQRMVRECKSVLGILVPGYLSNRSSDVKTGAVLDEAWGRASAILALYK